VLWHNSILGAIFGVSDTVAAEVLEITPDNFRQRLARARRDLRNLNPPGIRTASTNNSAHSKRFDPITGPVDLRPKCEASWSRVAVSDFVFEANGKHPQISCLRIRPDGRASRQCLIS
jgi:hypothetical protein